MRLPWWNVTEQRWEVAELPPRALRVSPSTDVAAAAARRRACRGAASALRRASATYWPWVSGILALAWLATVALWWRVAHRGARPAAAAPQPKTPVPAKPALRKVLRDLDSACAVGDPAAARAALLALCRGALRRRARRAASERWPRCCPRPLHARCSRSRRTSMVQPRASGAATGSKRLLRDLESAGRGARVRRGRAVAAAVSMRNQSRL